MSALQIIDGALVIDINAQKYPKLAAEMKTLDVNGDNKVAVDDFSATPEAERQDRFHQGVVNAFVRRKFMTEAQGRGMFNFFGVYNMVKKQKEIVDDWKNNHIDTWGDELEFDDLVYWQSRVEPQFKPDGVFYYNNWLEQELYAAMKLLSNLPGKAEVFAPVGDSCEELYKVKYNPDDVPGIIRDKFEQLMAWHKSSEKFLEDYDEVQCDGGDCPSGFFGATEEYNLFILETVKSRKWKEHFHGVCDYAPG